MVCAFLVMSSGPMSIKDMQDFSQMNTVYAEKVSSHAAKPARTTIQAAKLPLDCRVEITCIAYRGNRLRTSAGPPRPQYYS